MSETKESSHTLSTRSAIQQMWSGEALPSVPAVALRVIRRCRNPNIDFGELAKLISADPALAARLLRLANTCEFCGRRRIGSLRAALNRLGLSHTRALVLGFAFASELQEQIPKEFDIHGFWRNALTTCHAGRILARRVKPSYADDAFSAGLLQDIAILALRCALSHDYAAVLNEQANCPARELHEVEQAHLGTTHMEIGSRLLARWGLPPDIHRPVLYHHSLASEMPDDLPQSTVKMARILGLGDLAARVFNEPDRNISYQAFLYGAEEICDLSEQAARDALREVRMAMENTATAFDVDPSSMPSHEEIEAMAGHSVARLRAELGGDMSKLRSRISARRSENEGRQKSSAPVASAYDELTGLLTYENFLPQLKDSARITRQQGAPLALMILDIDHSSAIKRDHGEECRDEVIRALSRYTDSNLRPTDIIGRIGGDRLAVLLSHCDIEIALKPAERLRRGIARCSREWDCLPGGNGITVSVGLVVVESGSGEVTAQKILEKAHMCLCVAKSQGRNCTRHAVL